MLLNKKIKFFKSQRGMTLIELMAVVVIIGILATVAGAAIIGAFDKAKINADISSKTVIDDAVQRYVMDTGATVPTTAASPLEITATSLVDGSYLRSTPKNSAGALLGKVGVAQLATGGGFTVFYCSSTTAPCTASTW